MTNLQKYQITAAHERAVRASGFDARDPDARYGVRNPLAEQILASRGRAPTAQTRDRRAEALMRAKQGLGDLVRGRGLALLIAGPMLAAFAGKPAFAAPLEGLRKTAAAMELGDALLQIADGLQVMTASIPGLRDPVWSLALLGALLLFLILQDRRQKDPAMTRFIAPQKPEPADAPLEDRPDPLSPVAQKSTTCGAPPAPPKPALRWRMDGRSRMGKVRTENQDAFRMLALSDDRAALILCDGAGGVAGGKLAAETAAQAIADHLRAATEGAPCSNWTTVLEAAVDSARNAVSDTEGAGIATAIVAVLEQDRVHFATLGDGALSLIWPAETLTREDAGAAGDAGFMVQELLAPHHVQGAAANVIAAFIGDGCMVPPRIGSIRCEPGCMLLAMSDGAGDLLARASIAAHLDGYRARMPRAKDAPSLAGDLLRQLEEARDPDTGAYLHSDNMTLLIAALETSQSGESDHG